MRLLLTLFILLVGSSAHADRVLLETLHVPHPLHEIRVMTYLGDHLCEIVVSIDTQVVLTVYSVPNNLTDYAISKIQRQMPRMIAAFDQTPFFIDEDDPRDGC